MTRRNIVHCALGSTAAIAFLVIPAGFAFAQDDTAEAENRTVRRKVILIGASEVSRDEASWLGQNFHLHEKSGFAYTRQLKLAEKPFVLRIQGPVLRKQGAVGLAFKIRF